MSNKFLREIMSNYNFQELPEDKCNIRKGDTVKAKYDNDLTGEVIGSYTSNRLGKEDIWLIIDYYDKEFKRHDIKHDALQNVELQKKQC